MPAPGVGLDEPYDPLQPVQEEVGIAAAIHQQSSAVMALVAHLTSQSGDVLGDFSSVSLQSGTTKGVQRRERMQNDLASGSSTYFIQMMQQLHRRLHPSRPVPQDESELMGISVLQYLERQGGYRSHRELGLVAWVLGHAIDAAAAGDFQAYQRGACFAPCRCRTGRHRSGRLVTGLHVDIDGGTTASDVSREECSSDSPYPSLRAVGSSLKWTAVCLVIPERC